MSRDLHPTDPDAIARRIRWHHRTFQAYNIARLREMMRYLPRRRVSLFEAVPFLLHVNHPELTGYVEEPAAAFGIQRFYHSGFWKQGLRQYGLEPGGLRPYLTAEPVVHGLYLMGSIGTLAQTPQSDMDYWVITEGLAADDRRSALLSRKLERIAEWGQTAFGQQITFFVLDAQQVVRNAFAAVDAESSGSAQRTLLKEEFYRTFIFVAGRLPYWAVMPPGLDETAYGHWIASAKASSLGPVDTDDYIDLGAVARIDPGECIGALLWQLYKARHDPMKAMIKSALIGHYFFRQDDSGLLCEKIKAGFGGVSAAASAEDPYAVVFAAAEAFFDWIQDPDGIELIRRCIYLKLIGFPRRQPSVSGSPKAVLKARTVRSWGWSADVCMDMDAFARWDAGRWQDFEARIIRKIGFVLELLQAHGHEGGSTIDMDPGDMVDLKGRISAVFKRRPGKIDRCPAAIRARAADRLMMVCDPLAEKPWQVRLPGHGHPVAVSDAPLPLAGWLVRNRMISAAAPLAAIQILGKSPTVGMVERLVGTVAAFFGGPAAAAFPYRRPPETDRLLVALFSKTVFTEDTGLTVSYLWRNSWGEFFHETQVLETTDGQWSRLYSVAERIHRLLGRRPAQPGSFRIMDCRMAPEPRVPETVTDMIRAMDALGTGDDAYDTGGGTDSTVIRSAPILDLL